MKNRVCLILPYFGKLPNYFELWLKTASYNKEVDFLIFTDNNQIGDFKNIIWKKISFKEMKELINNKFDFNIKLNRPYKLCDFKPAYGYIFSEYIKNYDYWGHCDSDIIWGRLNHFINNSIDNGMFRIFQHGHLCIYKNEDENNRLFMRKVVNHGITYKDVFKMNYLSHFDEGPIINEIFSNKKTYYAVDFADIVYQQFPFKLAQNVDDCNCNQIYDWNNGKLCGYFLKENQIIKKEFAYIHLQKRNMEIYNLAINDAYSFTIVPNKFIPHKKIDVKLIIENSKKDKQYNNIYKKRRIKEVIENIFSGALKYRIIDKLK